MDNDFVNKYVEKKVDEITELDENKRALEALSDLSMHYDPFVFMAAMNKLMVCFYKEFSFSKEEVEIINQKTRELFNAFKSIENSFY